MTKIYKKILKDYENYRNLYCRKIRYKDNIEKNVVLLSISRKLFTHSLPLIVAIQCYQKLLKDARILLQDTKISAKREKVL